MTFLTSAVSQVEKEREEMRQQLAESKRQCRGLLQHIATLRKEQPLPVSSGGSERLGEHIQACGVWAEALQVGP